MEKQVSIRVPIGLEQNKIIQSLADKKEKWEAGISKKELIILEKFSNLIISKFPEGLIILYGSRARIEAREDSDFDVCILIDKANQENIDTIFDLSWEFGFENDIIIEDSCFSVHDFFSETHFFSNYIQTILRDGILINQNGTI